jgi:hypothetical protein
MRCHFRDERADIFWSITDIKRSGTLVQILSRFVRFPNEMGNGTRLQIHTRSWIPYRVSCLRFLILATLKFLPPALRGARGPSTDKMLIVEDSERTDSCTKGWLIPCIGGQMKVQRFQSLRSWIWPATRQRVLCVRAETDGVYKRNCTGCSSELEQVRESCVWELQQMECTRGIVQGVHLNWNRSESLVCESFNRWSVQEELYRVSIWTGTGERLGVWELKTDGLCHRNCKMCPSEEGQISSESGVWELKQMECTRGIVQGVHLNWNR